MARELGQLYVAVRCTNCGTHGEGKPAKNGRTRCGKCGAFGSEVEHYCQKHELDYSEIYPNDVHCPYCREESRRQSEYMHQATRDPQVEPW